MRKIFCLFLFFASCSIAFSQVKTEDLSKYNSAPDWFRDLRFGIFVHWGPYSVPAYAW